MAGSGGEDDDDSRGDGSHHEGVVRSTGNEGRMSYSDRLKANVRFDQRLKRNVLEITLEKTSIEADAEVSQEAIAKVFKTLGINIETEVEGSQVHFKGMTSVISVWMKAGVNIERFCKDISIKVSNGVMTGMIRPAGKKDVTVSIVGLDFNTPDSFVMDYVNKFGIVINNTVIYSKNESGPLRGKYTGERRYQVDFSKSNRQMGTYHLIDGCKVRVYYRGNKKTCGRCHKMASECPGEAVAKNCALGGGARVLLTERMKQLWAEIGFVPTNFELEATDKTEDDIEQATKDIPIIRENNFPPNIQRPEHSARDIEQLGGITIRNFPKTLNENQIHTFLVDKGLPIDHDKQNIRVSIGPRNTYVVVDGLSSTDTQQVFHAIHFHESKQKFFDDVPLYCKVMRNLTPEKKVENKANKEAVIDNTIDTLTTDTPNEPQTNHQEKPMIPGLPETDRLKVKKKQKKKKNKSTEKETNEKKEMSRQDFLVTAPKSTTLSVETGEFVFSDYPESVNGDDESDNADSDDSEDNFEDSREELSDSNDSPKVSPDLFTPASFKSAFAKITQAQSSSKPTSTPRRQKRSAPSPADSDLVKKTRRPKKK